MVKAIPADDFEVKTFEYDGQTYVVKNKFKIFKFFRALNENPVSAITLALEDESVERLEELEIDMDDFKSILEKISDVLAGTNAGN